MSKEEGDFWKPWHVEGDTFVLDSVDGCPRVEFRFCDSSLGRVLVRRRLLPDGQEYDDGTSDWLVVPQSDVLYHVSRRTPVGEWLMERMMEVESWKERRSW